MTDKRFILTIAIIFFVGMFVMAMLRLKIMYP